MLKWLRKRKKSDAVEAEAEHFALEVPPDTYDQALLRTAMNQRAGFLQQVELGALNGMTEREKEEFFSSYGPSEVRKEMRRRLKAREDAKKRRDKS